MDKVSKSWLKKHGFKETVYEDVEERHNHMQEVYRKKQSSYMIAFKDRWARFDCYYYVTTNKFGDKKISRYYMFYGFNKKTNFVVENRITHYLPTVEQMKSALNVIGIGI
ncbi:MAG: hypothetical protein IJH39_05240 [Clostridia bacterium]|nr:hypothetical protein [Clostridia bacterium]